MNEIIITIVITYYRRIGQDMADDDEPVEGAKVCKHMSSNCHARSVPSTDLEVVSVSA